MALLHMASSLPDVRPRLCVATFDHGTGPHAAAAIALVRAIGHAYRVPVVAGRAQVLGANEADWRAMRWRFLDAVAHAREGRVMTAHTRDDQVETVVMRLLRGASARGLAALYADSAVSRPLLRVPRSVVERYARAHGLAHVEDPTNADRRYLRNRVRLDLLPALHAVRPTFGREMLALSRRAARLRRRVERVAQRLSRASDGALEIDLASLSGLDRQAIALLWPAVVARLGVPLDRRGVERATDFVVASRAGGEAQCSGGIRLRRTRSRIVVTREVPNERITATVGSYKPVEPCSRASSYIEGGLRAG